jgi:hypothetical protein
MITNHQEKCLPVHEVVHVYLIFDKYIQQNKVFPDIYLNLGQHLTKDTFKYEDKY